MAPRLMLLPADGVDLALAAWAAATSTTVLPAAGGGAAPSPLLAFARALSSIVRSRLPAPTASADCSTAGLPLPCCGGCGGALASFAGGSWQAGRL
eukprot:11127626-Alexandrium_andersonii.AAC.1